MLLILLAVNLLLKICVAKGVCAGFACAWLAFVALVSALLSWLLWLAFRFVFIARLFATPFCHFELSLESENPKILVILSGVR